MIRYDLKCAEGHSFESWFQSAAAFDRLSEQHQVGCPTCGSTGVEKALMAPAVAPSRKGERAAGPLHREKTAVEEALAALRRQVEENADYVGLNFAAEARAIHAGEVPERSIYGEARPDEARALIEEGVPVAPLPFLPVRKTN